MAQIKVPKHQGPDGQGLPQSVFDTLTFLIETCSLTDNEIKQAIELCFGASTEKEWNTVYAPKLIKMINK